MRGAAKNARLAGRAGRTAQNAQFDRPFSLAAGSSRSSAFRGNISVLALVAQSLSPPLTQFVLAFSGTSISAIGAARRSFCCSSTVAKGSDRVMLCLGGCLGVVASRFMRVPDVDMDEVCGGLETAMVSERVTCVVPNVEGSSVMRPVMSVGARVGVRVRGELFKKASVVSNRSMVSCPLAILVTSSAALRLCPPRPLSSASSTAYLRSCSSKCRASSRRRTSSGLTVLMAISVAASEFVLAGAVARWSEKAKSVVMGLPLAVLPVWSCFRKMWWGEEEEWEEEEWEEEEWEEEEWEEDVWEEEEEGTSEWDVRSDTVSGSLRSCVRRSTRMASSVWGTVWTSVQRDFRSNPNPGWEGWGRRSG